MSTITTINASDQITNSRAVINTNFANLNTDKIETSVIDTDTALAANSDSKIPSQKAVKTYIDTSGGANASTTVRGIVEEATQAEVTAGTTSGATGARLFINPTHTVSSSAGSADEGKIPKLDSSGKLATSFLTIGKVEVDTTEVTVANTAVETTLFDVSVPAGTLSTNNALRVMVYLSNFVFNNDINQGIDFRLKYGATTLATLSISQTGTGPGSVKGFLEGYVVADGATNAQKGCLAINGTSIGYEDASSAAVVLEKILGYADGTAAEDSTAAKTLSVTADWGSGASSSTTLTAEFWLVEKIG